MASVKSISDRISYKKHPEGHTTVVIAPVITERGKFMMTFWIFAWTFCGIYVAYELLFGDYNKELKLTLVVFLVFWAYYEYRIGYAWMWKRKGSELLKFEDGILSYKRSIKTYGKAYQFHLDGIKDIEINEQNDSFASVLSNSFWVMGNERIRFDYSGKEIRVGMQLSDEEAKKLKDFILRFISESKKTVS